MLFTVLDAGEREDAKEAVLAYRGLLDGPGSASDVDERVESWLHSRCGDGVDFEVPDALERLRDLGLAEREGDRWSAVPLGQAPGVLRQRWRELGDRLVEHPEDVRRAAGA